MGYYTQYSLKQLRNPIPKVELAALIDADECARYALDFEGDTRKPEKWYAHEASLCAWSKQHPDTLFLLNAEGEDSDGIWEKYFLGGELVRVNCFCGFPKFDLDELRA